MVNGYVKLLLAGLGVGAVAGIASLLDDRKAIASAGAAHVGGEIFLPGGALSSMNPGGGSSDSAGKPSEPSSSYLPGGKKGEVKEPPASDLSGYLYRDKRGDVWVIVLQKKGKTPADNIYQAHAAAGSYRSNLTPGWITGKTRPDVTGEIEWTYQGKTKGKLPKPYKE